MILPVIKYRPRVTVTAPVVRTVRRMTDDRTTQSTDRTRRLLDLLALTVSTLDLVLTLRALRRRAVARRPLYRDGVLPRGARRGRATRRTAGRPR